MTDSPTSETAPQPIFLQDGLHPDGLRINTVLTNQTLDNQALDAALQITGTHTVVPQVDSSAMVGGDASLGVAGLGKTVLGLALVLLLIWGLGALFKRLGTGRRFQGQSLRIVASQSVGQRERVVIVEIDDTWLVLGVAPGRVNRLHELPAKTPLTGNEDHNAPTPGTGASGLSFSESFKRALSQRFNRRP